MAPPLGELSAKLTERALSALRAPLPEGEARLSILPRHWLVRQTTDTVILSGASAESKNLRILFLFAVESVRRSFDSLRSLRMTCLLPYAILLPAYESQSPNNNLSVFCWSISIMVRFIYKQVLTNQDLSVIIPKLPKTAGCESGKSCRGALIRFFCVSFCPLAEGLLFFRR